MSTTNLGRLPPAVALAVAGRDLDRSISNAIEEYKTLMIEMGTSGAELRREIKLKTAELEEWRADALARLSDWLDPPANTVLH